MDNKETLEDLLRESPVSQEVLLQYLSQQSSLFSPVRLAASIKLLDLHIEAFNKTAAPEKRAQLQQVIEREIQDILMCNCSFQKDEVTRIGRFAVDYFATANNWEGVYSAVWRSENREVADYAAEMARKYNAPDPMAINIYVWAALLNNNPIEAIRIAADAEDYRLLGDLRSRVPEELRQTIHDKLWDFAKKGKLPIESALRLAQQRGEQMPLFAGALLATAESPYDKAVLINQYNIRTGDLGTYILECAAELKRKTAELLGQLYTNPAEVAKQLEEVGKWEQVKNYRTHPEQSRQMDIAIEEAYFLKTDALILIGRFDEALEAVYSPNHNIDHPQKEWLRNLFRLAKNTNTDR